MRLIFSVCCITRIDKISGSGGGGDCGDEGEDRAYKVAQIDKAMKMNENETQSECINDT